MGNIIVCARELGAAIQESAEFQRLSLAREIQEADDGLQEKIQEFNLLRQKIINGRKKTVDKDDTKIAALEKQAQDMYEQIMLIPAMKEYMEAKRAVDKIMSEVNGILNYYMTGEEGCSADDCGGCQGCCGD